jgi:hypothetical protein
LFIWGCCGGNANNFETLADCEAACPPDDDPCFLPPDVGPCDGICPRFYYDPCTGQCEAFIWGCCGGNANNFETIAECEAACEFQTCPCDCADPSDGVVNVVDFLALIGDWGGVGPCDCAEPSDGVVNVVDFLAMLGAWGSLGLVPRMTNEPTTLCPLPEGGGLFNTSGPPACAPMA